MAFASSARELADLLERGDVVLLGPGQLLARLVELPLAIDELAVALLEHVGALVDLLVALEEAPLEVAELLALAAGLFLGLALQAELLVLGLEDQVLLLGPRPLHDQGRLLLGILDRLARPHAAGQKAEYGPAGEGHQGGHRHGHDIHLSNLPSGQLRAGGLVMLLSDRCGDAGRTVRPGPVSLMPRSRSLRAGRGRVATTRSTRARQRS